MKLLALPGPVRVEDPGRAVHRRVAAARRGGLPHVGDARPHLGHHRPAPGGGAASRWAAPSRSTAPYFAQMKDELPRARRRDRAPTPFEHAADLADGAGPAARAHPRGRARRRRVGGAARDRRARARGAAQPGRAARARRPGAPRMLELTFGISREIYANFLALREAMEQEHDLDRAAAAGPAAHLPRAGRSRWWSCSCSRRCSACSSRGAPPGGWPRCATAARRVGEGDLTVRVAPRGKRRAGRAGARVRSHGRRARRGALAPRIPAEGVGLAGGGAAAGARDQEPAHADPARGAGAGLEVPRRRSGLPAPAGDRAGDPERGDRRDPPAGRRLLGVRQAPQGRAGAGRSRPGRRGLRARAPRVAAGAAASSAPAAPVRRAVRPHADPARARQPGRERRAGGRGRRARARGARSPSRRDAERGASPRSSTTTAPASPRDARERIFDPYVTTKEHGTGPGPGDRAQDRHRPRRRRARRRRAVAARRRALHGHAARRVAGSCGLQRAPRQRAAPGARRASP